MLSYEDREIATISMLTVLEDVQAQLNSHINLGKNLGLSQAQINQIQSVATSLKPFESTFGEGIPNPNSQYFSGETFLNRLSDADPAFNLPAANVTFEPNAKTFWHKHSAGQILLATDGEGRYQERGKPVQILKKGDIVRIPANVEHWHGAASQSWFAHVALTPNPQNNQVTWLEEVLGENK
ncbi:MAG: cupin domain-containing protein [Brevinema sp.]